MNKKTRDWLFGTFVFLFVIITIILSLYATGYRFDLSWPLKFDRILVKTGTLALDTSPKGAVVTITSETKISSGLPLISSKKPKVTPIKIKNLLPGDYTVSFALDGYWPYEKKLRVNPEQTTFLENVILFKKSLPINTFTTKPQDIEYSANGNYAWLKSDNQIINLKTEQVSAKIGNDKANWASGGKQILDGSKLINLDNGNIQDFKNLGNIEEAQMSDNNAFLVYLYKNNLAAYDLATKATTLIPMEGQILAYGLNGNILFIVISDKQKTEFKTFDLRSKNFLKSEELLNSKNFSFKRDNIGTTILSDNEHRIIYIISPGNNNPISGIIRGASVFKWLDGNRLAYANESEIYIYDIAQNRPTLITRLGEKINSLAWSNNNYLIYSTANAIGTINLTDQGNDITILWQGSDISSLHFEDKDSVLYFSGTIGQQSGLYKMALK